MGDRVDGDNADLLRYIVTSYACFTTFAAFTALISHSSRFTFKQS